MQSPGQSNGHDWARKSLNLVETVKCCVRKDQSERSTGAFRVDCHCSMSKDGLETIAAWRLQRNFKAAVGT